MAEPPVPVSTYRLQLRAEFGFAQAAGLAGYLADLGLTHVYLSPILQAVPGSPHGYDVVDHSRVSDDLGGQGAFRAMVAELHRHGLGVVVDVVPNHMARPAPEWLNKQLWSVLHEGRQSQFAPWFDIDWDAQDGKLLVPILGGPVDKCLGDLSVEADPRIPAGAGYRGPVLRYFDHVLPLRDGTAGLPLGTLLDEQHYRLTDWHDANTGLNYRRFFDIDSLIAIRAEDPDVFAASHGLLLRLHGEGLIDGLRIDHPDGLADPGAYLRRLAGATGGAWVVVEKILAYGEQLPAWRCAGTTGYDALAWVDRLFTGRAGETQLTEEYLRFTRGRSCFTDVERNAKRYIADGTFTAELSRLIRVIRRAGYPAADGFTAADLHRVLAAVLAGFGVYRAYVTPGQPAPQQAVGVVTAAVGSARAELEPRLLPAAEAVRAAVLGLAGTSGASSAQAARYEVIVRFGQTTGPVMAKGVEDTAFYRWSRLVSLNEVGGSPDVFGIGPERFHAEAGRLARDWPATLTTLSSHDTKRQEDVRARLAVLAELPEQWSGEVTRWHAAAAALPAGAAAAARGAPEPDTEYLMWQTLVGAWPIDGERLGEYLTKAMREAKTRTSWTETDAGYEAAVLDLARAVLADPALAAAIEGFASAIAPDARANSLGAKLVQLTMPGVADVYQGCELAGLSLVDPDNRRPVDYQRRRAMLAALDAGEPAAGLDADKLLVTSTALRLRRQHPDWFGGSYVPLAAEGPAGGHAVAFARGGRAVTVATRLPAGLRRRGGWADTVLPLPGPRWRDVLTGTGHAGSRPLLCDLTGRLPVALLVPDRFSRDGDPS
ncbi:MAG: malto-oligosyltrehalose synthase [Streptosporangiaceae bacterium]|nr:malto-oligosyltrehalose synthase [Streptosporangiaceae bacterium]